MSSIVTEQLTKSFERGRCAVRDVSLHVDAGRLVALMGPSGCGKTTLLRIIAGLEQPDSGRVFIGGRDVTRVRPYERDVALVFQNHALYPHMTVRRNLTFALRMRGVARPERERRAVETARVLQIEPFLDRTPAELSGGERQRAAVARALVRQAACILFDEPLSALEVDLRTRLQQDIRSLQAAIGFTAIWVTHDAAEAHAMADHVLRMHEGRVAASQSSPAG